MSSQPSLIAVIPKTMSRGRMTSPGEMVENFGKNCRIAIPRKKLRAQFYEFRSIVSRSLATHTLAIRLNCSNRFRGIKVITVYLDVITWLVG